MHQKYLLFGGVICQIEDAAASILKDKPVDQREQYNFRMAFRLRIGSKIELFKSISVSLDKLLNKQLGSRYFWCMRMLKSHSQHKKTMSCFMFSVLQWKIILSRSVTPESCHMPWHKNMDIWILNSVYLIFQFTNKCVLSMHLAAFPAHAQPSILRIWQEAHDCNAMSLSYPVLSLPRQMCSLWIRYSTYICV